MIETPYCFSLLIAEFVQRDAAGKWNIIGVYDLLTFQIFPVDVSIAVFFGVIDGRGEMPIKLQLVDADDLFADESSRDPVGVVEGTIALPDPLLPIQATAAIPVRFDHPGAYHLELWVNGERLQTRRLVVAGPDHGELP